MRREVVTGILLEEKRTEERRVENRVCRASNHVSHREAEANF